ncbi:Hypothetical protein LUCI_1290 [Lucifera butyrica]|uniref:Uncharacterized protein n=1 Tax=Lucifera butyrica TaxID=1351585 RepID=A0A498R4M9_9FIRM|nr:Hypothetical protein LUCI_1290 [Lucifera butyrica]
MANQGGTAGIDSRPCNFIVTEDRGFFIFISINQGAII